MGERRPDLILLIVTLFLVTFGTVMIYSSSSILAMEKFGDSYHFLKKQIMFVLFGLVALIGLCNVPFQHLRKFSYPVMAVSVLLLSALLIPHVGIKAGGATRWMRLGPLSFQVSEMAKVALVIFLAHFLVKKAAYVKEFSKGILVPLLITAVLIGLVMLQPDFGASFIIAVILMVMLYLGGSRVLHMSALVGAIVPVGIFLICLKPYRLERLKAFLDPWNDPQHSGFQIIQSFLSFGSGGPFGVGLGDGMQKLFYLPEPHTDFILSIIAEEVGFIGVVIVLVLFMLFLFRGFVIAYKANDSFGTMLAAGLTTLIAIEAVINISAVMGLIPTKGLALPFMSYGGSSLVMSMASVGILLNISSESRK